MQLEKQISSGNISCFKHKVKLVTIGTHHKEEEKP